MQIQLIVGLGNPGDQYAKTRHNVGFWFAESLVAWHQSSFTAEKKFKGDVAELVIESIDQKCRVLCPSTFMNNSGDAVAAIAKFYQIPAENILVVYDDLDFAPGMARLKFGGGHGGHNGLRHINQCLGTADYWRLRLGIGHPGHKDLVTHYVLSKASKSDEEKIQMAIQQSLDVIPAILEGDLEQAMQQLHQESD